MAFSYPPTMPPTSISTRKPRWKGRAKLCFVWVAPGTHVTISPAMAYGMKRIHIQRVKRARGWMLETWWGKPSQRNESRDLEGERVTQEMVENLRKSGAKVTYRKDA